MIKKLVMKTKEQLEAEIAPLQFEKLRDQETSRKSNTRDLILYWGGCLVVLYLGLPWLLKFMIWYFDWVVR